MTDKDLTAPEAVERLAEKLMAPADRFYLGYGQNAAVTLRALSAALERKKEAAEFWEHCAAITEKRAEALDVKLKEAVAEYDDFQKENVQREENFARKIGELEARTEVAENKLQEAVAVMQYLKSEAWGRAPSFETDFHLDVHAECAALLASMGDKG